MLQIFYSIEKKPTQVFSETVQQNGDLQAKLWINFCPVSGFKQKCHSLPCYMIYEIYKLVEKTAKTPPLHLISLYFHKRAWFSNWHSEINSILLQPTMKANTTCQDYLPTTNAGQIYKQLWAEEQVFWLNLSIPLSQALTMFFLWGFLLLGAF